MAVTQGILELLSWDEFKGVLAHELAHVGNRDILITSIAAAIATGISYYLANMVMWMPFFGTSSSDEDEGGPNALGLLLAALLAPMAATILQLALSRSREFDADATGARLLATAPPWLGLWPSWSAAPGHSPWPWSRPKRRSTSSTRSAAATSASPASSPPILRSRSGSLA